MTMHLPKFGTNQSHPKPAKTTWKNCETIQNNLKLQNWGNLEFSNSFCFSNFKPNSQMLVFWVNKYQLSNLLTKFCLKPILQVLISNLTLVLENFEPKFEKFGHFGANSINFQILTKFLMYPFRRDWFQIWHWFSKISSTILQIWAFLAEKYQLFNLNQINSFNLTS